MSSGGPFPTSNFEFNKYLQEVVIYLNANKVRLGISADNITTLAALMVLWNPVYTQSESDTLATSHSRHQRDAYRAQLETLLRSIYHDIPDSIYTLLDRETLHVPEHDATLTPVGAPTIIPVVTVDKMAHLQHVLRFQNPETPDSHARPAGVATVEIYGFATFSTTPPPMPGPTPTEDNFHHIGGTGKFLYTVHFTVADIGKTVYYFIRYRNAKGEIGPDSEMVHAVVS